jgi:transcriptional regulator GlxA family with amidase domain
VNSSNKFSAEVLLPDSVLQKTGTRETPIQNVIGMSLPAHKRISQVAKTDIVIIPSLFILTEEWPQNPYPDLSDWLRKMHSSGSLICSACTGAFLLAETGLLNGYNITQHWAFERMFTRSFPEVRQDLTKILVITGEKDRIVMSGASAAWHDLVLHLIARYAGREAASVIEKIFLLNRHEQGQAPYMQFEGDISHEDAIVLSAQRWLQAHSNEPNPIEKVVHKTGINARTFHRRFQKATGCAPIHYVQKLRINKTKQLLETSSLTIEEIGHRVGYEDTTSFRRLFKRITNMTPKEYRKKFKMIL